MNSKHFQQLAKQLQPEQKGYSIHTLSLYELNNYAQTCVNIITNIQDVSQLVNQYGTNNPLKLALNVMIDDTFGAHCQRPILGNIKEVFPIQIDSENVHVKNAASMIQHQIDDF